MAAVANTISWQEPAWPGSALVALLEDLIPSPATFVSPSTGSRKVGVSNWWKYVHLVLVNCLGGLSLPRYGAIRLSVCLDMAIAVVMDVKQQLSKN